MIDRPWSNASSIRIDFFSLVWKGIPVTISLGKPSFHSVTLITKPKLAHISQVVLWKTFRAEVHAEKTTSTSQNSKDFSIMTLKSWLHFVRVWRESHAWVGCEIHTKSTLIRLYPMCANELGKAYSDRLLYRRRRNQQWRCAMWSQSCRERSNTIRLLVLRVHPNLKCPIVCY